MTDVKRTESDITMAELVREYAKGTNLIRYICDQTGAEEISAQAILKSYDIQTGSYIASLSEPNAHKFQEERAQDIIDGLDGIHFDSIVEAGCGEATTLVSLLDALPFRPARIAGFDISWSRAKYACNYAARNKLHGDFFMGEMAHIPLPDNAYDMVFTSHAIEPNRGSEQAILTEIYRVSARYAALIEPSYELATPEMQAHMDSHRYCRGLAQHAEAAGFTILKHHLLKKTNKGRTVILLLEKGDVRSDTATGYACPACKNPLRPHAGHLYCEHCMVVYPIIDSIPCLHRDNGIIASKYLEAPV